jgi:hypothetical protein
MPVPRLDDRLNDLEARLEPEVEAHLGQLQADVGVEPLDGDALDRFDVGRGGTDGRRPVGHALPKDVERCHRAGRVERPHGLDGVVEGRSGHEPQRHAAHQRRP